MTNMEYEKIQRCFNDLVGRMKRRDDDCAHPKTMVDKGYSLAVQHMEKEIAEILDELMEDRIERYNAAEKIIGSPPETKTEFDKHGCPVYCPGRECYPDCYCMHILEGE